MDTRWSLICLIFVLSCKYAAEACLKNNEPDTSGGGSSPGSTQSPLSESSCNPSESNAQRCLNGGTCYVVTILGHRETHCRCPQNFEGERCDIKAAPQTGKGDMQGGAIAGIVIGVLVLLILLGGIIFLAFRYRQKVSRPKLEEKETDIEPDNKSRASNYSASRFAFENNNFSRFPAAGRTNPAYNSPDVSINPNSNPPPPYNPSHVAPYTISSGNFSSNMAGAGGGGGRGGNRRSGTTVVDSTDVHSGSRPPSSTGGSLYHSGAAIGQLKTPLAYHETGV